MNALAFTGITERGRACVVDAADHVRSGVELHIDEAHPVRRRPGDRLLKRQFAADIDTDAFEQVHFAGAYP